MATARLAIDIGGTFTDVALDIGSGDLETTKVLTTHAAPEEAVLEGISSVLSARGLRPADISLVLHGTTLATNAIIEKKGARTALVATEGFRDVLAIGYEDRYDQYDIAISKPVPVVDRALRFTVPERIAADGEVLKPLDEDAVDTLVEELREAKVEALAVSLIHAYAMPEHEARIAAIVSKALPNLAISLSSEVSPEAREYERSMTTVLNAYVQPLMAGYLGRLEQRLGEEGVGAPVLLMTSGGGLTTLETARRFPVRLVESGPAGGAILAAEVARACGADKVLGFDMGGTTAKVCLIDKGAPQTARSFEVDRQARFTKGSGLPVRIPVIEMIEIGAGGGSIARLDALGRIVVGPQSAGSDPGPVAYGRGGSEPTVTDADLALGRLDPADFAGGSIMLDAKAAATALDAAVGKPLQLTTDLAAFGICEIVDENMANAARVHAMEHGADITERTMVAFGGAAPLHAGRLAEKLGIDNVIVPANAGVGSAVGFLHAPIAYELVKSRIVRLSDLDPTEIEALYAEMDAMARPIVATAAPEAAITATRTADLRYVGQGHEVRVTVPEAVDAMTLRAAFEKVYSGLFHRTIEGAAVEVLSWSLALSAPPPSRAPAAAAAAAAHDAGSAIAPRELFDPNLAHFESVPVTHRSMLGPFSTLVGPALIIEAATTTIVPPGFTARVHPQGHLILSRCAAIQEAAQ